MSRFTLVKKEKTSSHTIYTIFGIKIKTAHDFAYNKLYFKDFLQGYLFLIRLKKYPEKITSLALGSSHCQYSVVNNENLINCGIGSQDLYYSYQLYHKYASSLPNL